MIRIIQVALAVIFAAAACTQEPAPEPAPPPARQSIMELMQAVITPATDMLWQAEDPLTDAEWQALDAAAVTVIDTFETIRSGGSGTNDDTWAADPAFQAFIDTDIAAARLMRTAIAAQDMDRLFDAGNELYTPCEECHLQFNPGVVESY